MADAAKVAIVTGSTQGLGEAIARRLVEGALIRGLTPMGRATVMALDLNHEHVVAVRKWWIDVGWHPPDP